MSGGGHPLPIGSTRAADCLKRAVVERNGVVIRCLVGVPTLGYTTLGVVAPTALVDVTGSLGTCDVG